MADTGDVLLEPRDQVVAALELALRHAAAGDHLRAREALETVRDLPLTQLETRWPATRRPAGRRAGRSRMLDPLVGLRRRAMRRWRDRRLDTTLTATVLRRDRFRCRYCGAALVGHEHLVRLGELVGDDAFAPETGRSGGDGHEVFGAVGFVACGVVDRVRLGRAGGQAIDNLIAACPSCRLRRAGRPLSELGLDDPRQRPHEAAPDWCVLLEALQLPVGSTRLLVERAVLLDGATLNVGGTLVGHADSKYVDLRADSGGREVVADLDVIRTTSRGTEVQAHLSLHEMVVADGEVADVRVRLIEEGDTPIPLIAMPGCSATANRDVVEAVPIVRGARSRLVLETTSGLVVRAVPLATTVEVASVAVADGTLWLGLDMFGAGDRLITSVSLRRRDDPEIAALPFTLVDGRWRLDPADAPMRGPDASLWDVWVRWTSDHADGDVRAGRLRSDLRSLRDATVLPTCRIRGDGGEVKLVPYYTESRHFAVKVRTAPEVRTPDAEAPS